MQPINFPHARCSQFILEDFSLYTSLFPSKPLALEIWRGVVEGLKTGLGGRHA
jgi:hypothetical protein